MYIGDKRRGKEEESKFRKGWKIDSYGYFKYLGYKREKESHRIPICGILVTPKKKVKG